MNIYIAGIVILLLVNETAKNKQARVCGMCLSKWFNLTAFRNVNAIK